MTDYLNLHRDDFQLLAGLFANGLLAATAFAGQFVFGQFVDDLDTWQLGRQRLALATALGRRDGFFLNLIGRCFRRRFGQAFRFVEHDQLR
ncbi:hypothetical protein FQZ97_1036710 [compost metagenome]